MRTSTTSTSDGCESGGSSRAGWASLAAVAVALLLFGVFVGALPTRRRAQGTYILPVPPVGGVASGLAGTTDPATLAQAQLFDVRWIVSLDEETEQWRWYIPGAPAFANTLIGRLTEESQVLIARSGSLEGRLAPLGTLAVELRRAAHSAMIAISDGERWLYVANTDSGTVSVIDTEAGVLVSELGVGAEPRSIALDPRGARAYVTNFADATVSVVDLVRREVIDRVATLRGPYGVVVSPDGATLFVAESATSTIGVYATDSMRRIGVVRVEPDPRGLAVSADGTRLYVTHFLSGRVSVLDVEARVVLDVALPDACYSKKPLMELLPSSNRVSHVRQETGGVDDMAWIDETIASFFTTLKIEGKTGKTIESYANSLEDFRRVGRRLGLPETVMRRPRHPAHDAGSTG